jgi:Holliday junction resolvasome RuvABC DNA-binding subunit
MTLSPMMKQYEEAKAASGEAILLFRMGDFYELFHEDAKTLEKVKGIGAKTAQRILLELKGKDIKPSASAAIAAQLHNTIPEDALIALVNLGISKNLAEAAIKRVTNAADLTVEELIKQALRSM